MSSAEDNIIETEVRDMWWEVGEAVMKEMYDDDDKEVKDAIRLLAEEVRYNVEDVEL